MSIFSRYVPVGDRRELIPFRSSSGGGGSYPQRRTVSSATSFAQRGSRKVKARAMSARSPMRLPTMTDRPSSRRTARKSSSSTPRLTGTTIAGPSSRISTEAQAVISIWVMRPSSAPWYSSRIRSVTTPIRTTWFSSSDQKARTVSPGVLRITRVGRVGFDCGLGLEPGWPLLGPEPRGRPVLLSCGLLLGEENGTAGGVKISSWPFSTSRCFCAVTAA
jgi:hypothetical protein